VNSIDVVLADVIDIIIAGILILYALIIGDKAAESKSVIKTAFILKVLLRN
jgi:hypothetical protein